MQLRGRPVLPAALCVPAWTVVQWTAVHQRSEHPRSVVVEQKIKLLKKQNKNVEYCKFEKKMDKNFKKILRYFFLNNFDRALDNFLFGNRKEKF